MDDLLSGVMRARPSLVAWARRRLPPHDAVDAVDEAVARAWARRRSFRPTSTVEAWLHGILRNVVRERCRRPPPVAVGIDLDSGTVADDPGLAVVRAEDAAAVRAAVARLDRASQQVIVLRFEAGLTSREIGVVLTRQAAAVRMAQTRALRRLREDLSAQTA